MIFRILSNPSHSVKSGCLSLIIQWWLTEPKNKNFKTNPKHSALHKLFWPATKVSPGRLSHQFQAEIVPVLGTAHLLPRHEITVTNPSQTALLARGLDRGINSKSKKLSALPCWQRLPLPRCVGWSAQAQGEQGSPVGFIALPGQCCQAAGTQGGILDLAICAPGSAPLWVLPGCSSGLPGTKLSSSWKGADGWEGLQGLCELCAHCSTQMAFL